MRKCFSCTLRNVHCVVNDFVLLMLVLCNSFYFVQIIMCITCYMLHVCRQQYGPMCYLCILKILLSTLINAGRAYIVVPLPHPRYNLTFELVVPRVRAPLIARQISFQSNCQRAAQPVEPERESERAAHRDSIMSKVSCT